MIIRKLEDIRNTGRDVEGVGFNSIRFLLKKDGIGYTFCHTEIKKGGPYFWHYKNHLESCYCISGQGVIRDVKNNASHKITPGTMYILNEHDPHEFTAYENTVLISVFNPPLNGSEVHKEDGSYV